MRRGLVGLFLYAQNKAALKFRLYRPLLMAFGDAYVRVGIVASQDAHTRTATSPCRTIQDTVALATGKLLL